MRIGFRRSINFIFPIVISICFSIFINGCQQKSTSDTNITIGIGTWAGFGTAIVGMEKGYFNDVKVKTRIIDDNSARHAAFQSGSIDIMISSFDVFAQEASQGIPGKVILVTDESWGGDGVVSKKDVRRIQDLRGRKIAYARGTPSHYLIYNILKSNSMSLDDIRHVQVDDPGRAGDIYLSGSVDAAVTWEPFLTQIAESGKGHILATTKDYPGIIIDLLVASQKLSNDGDTLKRFINGWLKTVDYIKGNQEEAAKIMAKGLNLPVEDVKGMMMGLKFSDRDRNKQFFSSIQPKDSYAAELLNRAGRFWQSVKIVDKPVDGASRISQVACKLFNGK